MFPVLRGDLRRFWDEPTELMRREFDRFWPESAMPGADLVGQYPMDVREEDGHFIIDAEMPGFKKDEIDVTVDNGVLSISAERKPEETKGKQHLRERRYTRVQRSLTLPRDVDENDVKATYEDGLLHLEIKKTSEAKGRKIKVS